MAWYDRIGRAIRNLFGGEEEAPAEEPPEDFGFPEEPDIYPEPEPTWPQAPTDYGFPIGEPVDYDYGTIWSDKWNRGVNDKGYERDWQEEEITIENYAGIPVTHSIEDWHNFITEDSKEELLATYGMDTLYIIRELEDLGLWDAEDWETWRNEYAERAG